ncbi:MAG: hypothetical protein HDT39_05470 [Lachnospiraceae bacterium]|nr:hypothetical protein [Lachnospiraceae bacterium]
MTNGRKINTIISKSFIKDGKVSLAFISVCILCSIIITVFLGILTAITEVKRSNAEDKYGSYQFGFMNITHELAEKVSREEGCTKSTIFESEYIEMEDYGFYKMYVDNDFFDISDVKIAYGKAPCKKGEIVCSKNLLNLFGYKYCQIGDRIEINDESFVLTGILSGENYSEDKNSYTMITSLLPDGERREKCAVMVKSEYLGYGDFLDSLSEKYCIDSINIFINNSVILYSGIDRYNHYIGIMKVFYYICCLIVIPCSMLTSIVAVFYGRKISHICRQYISLGIESKMLFKIFSVQIFSIILSVISLSVVLASTSLYLYFNLNKIDVSVFPLIKHISVLLIIYGLISFAIPSFAFWANNVFHNDIHKKNKLSVKENVRKKSILMEKSDSLYMMMSMENMHFGKTRHLLLVLMIAFSCAMFAGIGYSLEQYTKVNYVTDEYDYSVAFRYKDFDEEMYGSKRHKQIYDDICDNQKMFSILPMYRQYTYAKVGKTMLDKDYKKYLASLSDEYNRDINGSSTKIRIPVMILGLDNELAKKYGIEYDVDSLNEGECILLKYTPAPDGKYGYNTGLNENSPLNFNFGANDDLSRSDDVTYVVKEIINKYNVSLFTTYYTQIVVVNMGEYKKFTDITYPDMFYVKSIDKSGTSNYFEDLKNVDITELASKCTENKRQNVLMKVAGLIVFGIVLLMIFLIIEITAYIGYVSMKRQAAAFYAIGIDRNKIARIFTADIIRIFENSFILSILCSIGVTYGIYVLMKEEMYFYQYIIPWRYVFAPSVIVGVAMVVASVLIHFIIDKMNVVEILNCEY